MKTKRKQVFVCAGCHAESDPSKTKTFYCKECGQYFGPCCRGTGTVCALCEEREQMEDECFGCADCQELDDDESE